MSLDIGNTSSSFSHAGKPDRLTKDVQSRFKYEARNKGPEKAFKGIHKRNAERKERLEKSRNSRMMSMAKNHIYGVSVPESALKAKGSRITDATIDGVNGLLCQDFCDGKLIREIFKPY